MDNIIFYNMSVMEISMKCYGKEFKGVLPEDSDIYEVMDAIGGLLTALTFSKDTIIQGMKNYIDENDESSSSE